MNAVLRWCRRPTRAVAAIEFAVTLPILLFFLGAVTDFGISYYAQGCLSSVVAAGAAYATTTEATDSSMAAATLQSNIESAMRGAAKQSLPAFAVTVLASDPSQCYCITGTSPNSQVTSATCGVACGGGGTASQYVQLTVSTTYKPMLPSYSMLTGTQTLQKSAWVPLQ
jgi:Flp pilus assembly protein TadG